MLTFIRVVIRASVGCLWTFTEAQIYDN